MWKRFHKFLCCDVCKDDLELQAFNETLVPISADQVNFARKRGLLDDDFNRYIDAGLLLCHGCKIWFPITHGLPILIPYTTHVHEQFSVDFKERISQLKVAFNFPAEKPPTGEQFVMKSFSKEWLNYEYDGVIWGMNYADHEKRFLSEVGHNQTKRNIDIFLELGCGLGLTTYLAHKNYEAEAVGVDLSHAVFLAAEHYGTNPFVHFIQASVFHMPLREGIADVVYSHGVLHHTYSTYEAFKALAPHCRSGGLLYIWVYGTGSKKGSLLRRIAYIVEVMVRPIIARYSSSFLSGVFLAIVACVYMAINVFHRYLNPHIQPYSYKRAVHAARDRFTPLYAHRHDYSEVSRWFQEAGFEEVQQVDCRTMPLADQDNYKRNVGLRGKRL